MRRVIVAGVGGVMAVGLGIGLFSIPSRGPAARPDAIALVGVRPQEVRSLEVRSDAGQALVLRDGSGAWSPGEATPAASASLAYESQAALFPLRAYRRLEIDAGSPEVGLTKPQYEVNITEASGRRSKLDIGRANFIGAGFYARLSGDPQVYLVARGTVDVLRSVVTGQRFESPRSAKETAFLNDAPDDSDLSGPWQRQAVGARP